jgi:hypothetical protein
MSETADTCHVNNGPFRSSEVTDSEDLEERLICWLEAQQMHHWKERDENSLKIPFTVEYHGTSFWATVSFSVHPQTSILLEIPGFINVSYEYERNCATSLRLRGLRSSILRWHKTGATKIVVNRVL